MQIYFSCIDHKVINSLSGIVECIKKSVKESNGTLEWTKKRRCLNKMGRKTRGENILGASTEPGITIISLSPLFSQATKTAGYAGWKMF